MHVLLPARMLGQPQLALSRIAVLCHPDGQFPPIASLGRGKFRVLESDTRTDFASGRPPLLERPVLAAAFRSLAPAC